MGPQLIFDEFNTPLGRRIQCILQHLFPASKMTNRVVTFANQSDNIGFRHHSFFIPTKFNSPSLTELGPRLEMKLYKIKLGTLDQTYAELEWELNPHIRNAKKLKLS